MKSLVIVKGLVKYLKRNWVKKQGLLNFFLDAEKLKELYYRPEYKGQDKEFLIRSFDDLVYQRFIEALCLRLSTGCLVIVDCDDISQSTIETLGTIFGYKLFYHIEKTPTDFKKNYRRYLNPQFIFPLKEEVTKIITEFDNSVSNLNPTVDTYEDLEIYWKSYCKPLLINDTDKILHISDIHSNKEKFDWILKNTEPTKYRIAFGDYIDGPEMKGSRKRIDYILTNEDPNTIWLEGNHELRLRKYLGFLYFKEKGKNTAADILKSSISNDFFSLKTNDEFNLSGEESMGMIKKLNEKLKPFIVYEKNKTEYICTHAGPKWIEQLRPKYVGSVIYSNRNMDRIDDYFSKKYEKYNIVNIHGHCKYPTGLNFTKYPNIINFDTEDESKVNYFIETNKIYTI